MEGSINFGALEELIEDARLNSDWVACKSGLEQYAHIFELPSSYSTSFHADTKAMKAYYWLCMTDSTFYSTGDFDQSVDFLRRAIAIYPTHPDICLILVKILIRSSIQLLQAQLGLTNLQDVTLSSVKFDRSVEHVTLATVLGDRIQVCSNPLIMRMLLM